MLNQNNVRALSVIRAIQQLNQAVGYMKVMDADKASYYASLAADPGGDDCWGEIYGEYQFAVAKCLKVILDLPKDYAEVVEYNNQLFKLQPWGSAILLNPLDEEALQYYADLVEFKAGWAAKHHGLGLECYVYWVDENSILWVSGYSPSGGAILIDVDGYELIS